LSINKDFIDKLVRDIKESIDTIKAYVSKPYEGLNEVEKYAIRYHLIVIAEALMSAILHVVRRAFGFTPETPIHALSKLRDEGLISNEELRDITNIIKLRNLLVHRYWIIDDRRVYENILKDFHNILTFIKRLQEYASRV